MADDLNKQRKKAMLQQWRSQQRAAARAKLRLADEQMQALFDMLNAALFAQACDHTLRLVQQWADEHAVDFEALAAWCRDNGGYCDCEVLFNCEERWQDAISH